MKEKDKYLFLELVFTFSLLLLTIYLLREILFGYHPGLLIFGLVISFSFSWLNRGRKGIITFMMPIAVMLFLVWTFYSLFNSSFIYREAVSIVIKGALILEVILSFDACSAPLLSYIQALSILLFMSSPLFIKNYNEISVILILGYFIIWFGILKVKFYSLFTPVKHISYKRYYPAILELLFFLVVLFISWVFFPHFSFGKFKKGGLFLEPGDYTEKQLDSLEGEYYELQDKIQNKITNLIPKINSFEEQYEILALLSSLIEESPYTIEVDKAELGLNDYLKRQGPGLERGDTEELMTAISNYKSKKIVLNLNRISDAIMSSFKKNYLNLKDIISASSSMNKIQHSNSYQQINKYERELTKAIINSSLDTNAKREFKESIGKFREWKVFELYQKKMNSIKGQIGSYSEQVRQELSRLVSDIERARRLEDMKQAIKKNQELQDKGYPGTESIIKDIKETLDLKLDMLLFAKNKELKEKIRSLNLSKYELNKLAEFLDNIKDAQDNRDFQENSLRLKRENYDNVLGIAKEIEDFLETKANLSAKLRKETIEDLLKENIPANLKKEFLESLDRLESEDDSDRLISDMEKMKENIQKFFKQGFISENSRDNLKEETEGLKNLFLSRLKIFEGPDREDAHQYKSNIDYQEKGEKLIRESSLNNNEKQVFTELIRELFKAQTLPELKNIKETIEQQIKSLYREADKKEEAGKLKEKLEELTEIQKMFAIDRALFGLRQKTEELNKVDPQRAETLNKYFEKIRTSKSSKELEENIDKLKECIMGQKSIKQDEAIRFEGNRLQLHVLPTHLVMPVGSSSPLKIIVVYKDTFLKEINSDLEWLSSDPHIAWVDENGVIHSISQGKINIHVQYKGTASADVDVRVVSNVDKEINRAIKQELGK